MFYDIIFKTIFDYVYDLIFLIDRKIYFTYLLIEKISFLIKNIFLIDIKNILILIKHFDCRLILINKSSCGRVVKASDSKSDSLWERRFESYQLRFDL